MTTATERLSTYKQLLDDFKTSYCHALARGDWQAVGFYQKQVHKMRSEIGRIVKKQMGLS